MSISSVPGANSVFLASLPIDSLPIDKVWERVCRVAAPVKARERKISLLSNRMRPAIPRLSDTMPQFSQLPSDKAVLLTAALEGYFRSAYSEQDCRIGVLPRSENGVAGSEAMRTSTSNVLFRVNWRGLYRICGKPDWGVFINSDWGTLYSRIRQT